MAARVRSISKVLKADTNTNIVNILYTQSLTHQPALSYLPSFLFLSPSFSLSLPLSPEELID